jgi:hypothetical protein
MRIETGASFITKDFHDATVKDSRSSHVRERFRHTSSPPIEEQYGIAKTALLNPT